MILSYRARRYGNLDTLNSKIRPLYQIFEIDVKKSEEQEEEQEEEENTGWDVVRAHSSQNVPIFPPAMGYPYIIHRSKQKTSTSKPKVRFSRKKRKRKREKVCFSFLWCRWFTQKWWDGHAWMGRRDGSRERRSDRSPPVGGPLSPAPECNRRLGG